MAEFSTKPTHQYSIKEDQGYISLFRDDKLCQCPKSAIAVPVQTMAGMQFGLQKAPCSTACPHADVVEQEIVVNKDEEPKLLYRTTCEGTIREFELSPNKPEGSSKLVSM